MIWSDFMLTCGTTLLFWPASSSFVAIIFLLGLPGRIAVARNHFEAEAVNLMGYLGFAAVVPLGERLHLGVQTY